MTLNIGEGQLILKSEISLFNCRVMAPEGTNLRLDQPCVETHGSIGGWLTEAGEELTFTLLWRPLQYWHPSAPVEVPTSPEGWTELNDTFIETAVVSSRRDAARTTVDHHRPATAPTDHLGADIALDLRPRRRRMRSIDLRRRQLLWTCPESQRHMAFEVSVLAQSKVDLDAAFEQFLPTLACHTAVGYSEPASSLGSEAIRIP